MLYRKQLLAALTIFLFLALLVAGCSTAEGPANNKNKKTDVADDSKPEKQTPPDINLALYFVEFNADQAYLVREVHAVSNTEQVAEAALQELINDEKSILPAGTKVLGINIDKGLATVNFSKEVLNNFNVGSEGEALGIQSIVNTLTEFPNIEKVAFQVEGKTDGRVKDWWGHVGLYNQPFTRDLSMVYKPTIWVTHPSPHQVTGVPLLVKGSARVFEGTVNARLLDDSGNVLVKSFTTASAGAPERGDFEMSLKFKPPSSGEGTLEVFWTNPKDGSPRDVVSIPVRWP